MTPHPVTYKRHRLSAFRTYETVAVSLLIAIERIRKVPFRQALRMACGGYTTGFENAHGTEFRKVPYPDHP